MSYCTLVSLLKSVGVTTLINSKHTAAWAKVISFIVQTTCTLMLTGKIQNWQRLLEILGGTSLLSYY